MQSGSLFWLLDQQAHYPGSTVEGCGQEDHRNRSPVVHSVDQHLNPNMSQVRADLVEPVKEPERVPREKMLEIANSCYEAIVQDNGEPKVMKITGVPGITERENRWGPLDLPAAHVFKIKNGQIYDIEAMGYFARHGIRNGWE